MRTSKFYAVRDSERYFITIQKHKSLVSKYHCYSLASDPSTTRSEGRFKYLGPVKDYNSVNYVTNKVSKEKKQKITSHVEIVGLLKALSEQDAFSFQSDSYPVWSPSYSDLFSKK